MQVEFFWQFQTPAKSTIDENIILVQGHTQKYHKSLFFLRWPMMINKRSLSSII